MAKMFYKKEYFSDKGSTYGIGFFDTDQTYNDEGQDYLVDVLFIDIDKNFIGIQLGQDFIDVEDVDKLNKISEEDFHTWEKFFAYVHNKAQDMIDGKKTNK